MWCQHRQHHLLDVSHENLVIQMCVKNLCADVTRERFQRITKFIYKKVSFPQHKCWRSEAAQKRRFRSMTERRFIKFIPRKKNLHLILLSRFSVPRFTLIHSPANLCARLKINLVKLRTNPMQKRMIWGCASWNCSMEKFSSMKKFLWWFFASIFQLSKNTRQLDVKNN